MKTTLTTSLLLCSALGAFGQGTVDFSNGFLYRISTAVPGSLLPPTPVPTTPGLIEYGLFFGIGQSTSLTLLTSQFGVNSTSVAGLIASPADSRTALTLVPIPGTSPNEKDVWFRMAGWSASFGTDFVAAHNAFLAGNTIAWWGQSAIANITDGLGATIGPGAAIWTFSTNTSGTVMPAFILYNIPEPAALALFALSVSMVMGRRCFRASSARTLQ